NFCPPVVPLPPELNTLPLQTLISVGWELPEINPVPFLTLISRSQNSLRRRSETRLMYLYLQRFVCCGRAQNSRSCPLYAPGGTALFLDNLLLVYLMKTQTQVPSAVQCCPVLSSLFPHFLHRLLSVMPGAEVLAALQAKQGCRLRPLQSWPSWKADQEELGCFMRLEQLQSGDRAPGFCALFLTFPSGSGERKPLDCSKTETSGIQMIQEQSARDGEDEEQFGDSPEQIRGRLSRPQAASGLSLISSYFPIQTTGFEHGEVRGSAKSGTSGAGSRALPPACALLCRHTGAQVLCQSVEKGQRQEPMSIKTFPSCKEAELIRSGLMTTAHRERLLSEEKPDRGGKINLEKTQKLLEKLNVQCSNVHVKYIFKVALLPHYSAAVAVLLLRALYSSGPGGNEWEAVNLSETCKYGHASPAAS
ncbi:hypothetical protein MC885_006135, partial [Smutsia gigantea]